MSIHRLEKAWIIFGIGMLIIFLVVLGAGTFAMGMEPPTSHHHTIDPTKVSQTAPFDKPRLEKIGDNEYNAYMVAMAFSFSPADMEIPVGAKVHFEVTSPDVVHGFQIPGTNVNMMIIPGQISHFTYTFNKAGDFLILCNEYCGAAHQFMATKIIVK